MPPQPSTAALTVDIANHAESLWRRASDWPVEPFESVGELGGMLADVDRAQAALKNVRGALAARIVAAGVDDGDELPLPDGSVLVRRDDVRRDFDRDLTAFTVARDASERWRAAVVEAGGEKPAESEVDAAVRALLDVARFEFRITSLVRMLGGRAHRYYAEKVTLRLQVLPPPDQPT